MCHEFEIQVPNETYASKENVRAAIKRYPNIENNKELRYFIEETADGRYFPVFVGASAVHAGVHFVFNVVA